MSITQIQSYMYSSPGEGEMPALTSMVSISLHTQGLGHHRDSPLRPCAGPVVSLKGSLDAEVPQQSKLCISKY